MAAFRRLPQPSEHSGSKYIGSPAAFIICFSFAGFDFCAVIIIISVLRVYSASLPSAAELLRRGGAGAGAAQGRAPGLTADAPAAEEAV